MKNKNLDSTIFSFIGNIFNYNGKEENDINLCNENLCIIGISHSRNIIFQNSDENQKENTRLNEGKFYSSKPKIRQSKSFSKEKKKNSYQRNYILEKVKVVRTYKQK